MNIEVYYHIYIPPDDQGAMRWTWYVDEQLSIIRKSNLYLMSTVYACITMPMYWYYSARNKTFHEEIVGYINKRYPFVNIIDVRDTGEENIFEGQTLRHLYNACQQRDIAVLYFHSKGAGSNIPQISCWREILNYYCIRDWPTAVRAINKPEIDLVGVRDAVCKDHMVSGNFWWSKSSYIRTLPDPIRADTYQIGRPSFHPGGPDYRYSFEDWVWLGPPRVHHLADTKVDHYQEFRFLEDMKA